MTISYWAIWQIVEWVLRVVMTLVILRRRFTPAVSLAWLSVVFFLPELGVVIYALIGDNRLPRRRIRRYRRLTSGSRPALGVESVKPYAVRPALEPGGEVVVRQAERISGMPILGGNEVELIGDPWFMVERLVADIDAAEHHVHLLFYIFAPDKSGRAVAEALERATKRGVKCRLLADDVGSRDMFYDGELPARLTQLGVDVRRALPVAPLRRRLSRLDLRNHRKLAIVDARVAYTGSQNIVDDDTDGGGEARVVDMMGRFRGPIVNQLQHVFIDDWFFETGDDLSGDGAFFPAQPMAGETAAQAVATGPTWENESLVRVILAAITAAQRRLVITTPYFVPDEATTLALQMAADRGVEVDLVVPRRSDHALVSAAGRAHYEPCLESGVRIHQHTGAMLHSKTISVDDSLAVLGSSNIDVRSFYLNFELSVLLYGKEITRQLRTAQLRYIEQSEAVVLETWRRRPIWRRYVDSAAALLSPLL